MGFSLSGSVITQSGTDTDLSGLSGIAGVDVSGTVYTIPANLRLVVTGTLTIVPEDNVLQFLDPGQNTGNARMEVNGNSANFTFGRKTIVGSKVTYSRGVGLIFLGSGGTVFDTARNGALITSSGSPTINMFGGTIVSGKPISLLGRQRSGGGVFRSQGTFLAEETTFAMTSDGQLRIDCDELATFNAKNIRLLGSNENVILVSESFNSLSATFDHFVFQSFAGQLRALRLDDVRFSNNQAASDFRFNNGEDVIGFVNSDTGSSTRLSFGGGDPCHMAIFGQANIKCLDVNGTPVDTAKYYIEDSDDGSRFGPIGDTSNLSDIIDPYGAASTTVYSGLVDASGEASPTILCSTFSRGGTNSDYSNGGSFSDSFDVGIADYASNLASQAVVLRTPSGTPANFFLLEDGLITEPVKATAAAYTQQETAAKAYDQLKSILVDNYAGETETIVTRTGNTLDARALNVVIDGTGSGPATIIGNTLTLNCSTFSDNIETTGTVTGKEFVAGSVLDATQDTTLSTSISVSEWYLYENIANANADTNRLVSSPSGSTQGFLLSSLPVSTGLVMRYVQGTAISFETNISLTTGANTVELGLQAGVNNITATVQESSIISKYAGHITVDTMDGETGTAFPFGTDLRPVDTIANGIAIAELYGIYNLEIRGETIPLPQTILGYTIGSARVPDVVSPEFPRVTVTTAMDFAHCQVNNLAVSGAFNTAVERGLSDFNSCVLSNVSGLEANAFRCKLGGTINCAYDSDFNTCYGSVTLDCTGLVDRTINFVEFSGNITITNLTDPSTVIYVGCLSADVTIDSSCTAGVIVPVDYDRLTNNGTSTVDPVNQHIITQAAIADVPNTVWDEPVAEHSIVGSTGEELQSAGGNGSGGGGSLTAAEVYTYFTDLNREDVFKADVSTLATQTSVNAIPTNPLLTNDLRLNNLDATISSRSTFNPTTDTVARVTLVDTTTANTDMRGTDGANTVAPDNASITAILADTNELQLNQGDWTTATGFSTHSQADVVTAMQAVADDFKADVSNLSADVNVVQVNGVAVTNINDFKADVSGLASQSSVDAIPTNPLLTNDVRLNNIDTTISSRLPASSYTVPPTVPEIRAGFTASDFQDKNTETELHSWLDSYTNKAQWQADVSNLSADVNIVEVNGVAVTSVDDFKADVSNLSADVNVVQVNGTNVTSVNDFKANISGLATQASVNAIPTNPLLTNDVRLNSYSTFDPSTNQVTVATNNDKTGYTVSNTDDVATSVRTELATELARLDTNVGSRLATTAYTTPPTTNEIYTEFTTGGNEDAFKADVSGLSTLTGAQVTTLVDASIASADLATDTTLQTLGTNLSVDISSVQAVVDLMLTYHDGRTEFIGADGVTEVPQSQSFFVVTYEPDGVTEAKRIGFRNASDLPVNISQATRLVKL